MVQGFPSAVIVRSPPHRRVSHGEATKAGIIEVTERMRRDLRHQLFHHRPPILLLHLGGLLIPRCHVYVNATGTTGTGPQAGATTTAELNPPKPLEDPSSARSEGPKRTEAAQGGGSSTDQQRAEGGGVGLVHPKHVQGEEGIKP